ncbi:MAG: flagellar basal body-associated FliL family protein [Deltaproteobacteria bacterium]|nr:flagellar basal body-associated FliL family protein [Deltaproteobacteria bacterium]
MSKKGLIILAISFLIVAVGVGAGLFVFWGKVSGTVPETMESAEEAAEKRDVKVTIKSLLSLDTFVVNLADPGGRRYLRVTMTLELKDKDFDAEAKKNVPQMRDRILLILPAKKFKDIRTASGKESLRKEIIAQLNPLLDKNEITNLYFQEFVIQ